ncbi:transposase, partial [Xanthomonas oryzae]
MSVSCCPTIHEEERRTFGIAGGAGRNAPDGVATDGRRPIAGRSGVV